MDTRKKIILLPYRFQVAGWILAVVSALSFIYGIVFLDKPLYQNDPAIVGEGFFCLALFLIGISRERQEDEFTLFLRTRSALTAVVIMFGLNIIMTAVFVSLSVFAVYNETIHEGVFNSLSFADFFKGFRRHTSYGGAFILYLILYKIRLAIYKSGARDEE